MSRRANCHARRQHASAVRSGRESSCFRTCRLPPPGSLSSDMLAVDLFPFRLSAPTRSAISGQRRHILGKRPPASAASFGTLARRLDLKWPRLPILTLCVPLAGPLVLAPFHGIGSFRSLQGEDFLRLSPKLHAFKQKAWKQLSTTRKETEI
jgi:hypothetical protein